jgi:hypothetical protein
MARLRRNPNYFGAGSIRSARNYARMKTFEVAAIVLLVLAVVLGVYITVPNSELSRWMVAGLRHLRTF